VPIHAAIVTVIFNLSTKSNFSIIVLATTVISEFKFKFNPSSSPNSNANFLLPCHLAFPFHLANRARLLRSPFTENRPSSEFSASVLVAFAVPVPSVLVAVGVVVVESVVIASWQSSMLVQRWWQQGSQWVMVRMHIVVF
jgi:hypothetical protein